jgi:hypothetical protein
VAVRVLDDAAGRTTGISTPATLTVERDRAGIQA